MSADSTKCRTARPSPQDRDVDEGTDAFVSSENVDVLSAFKTAWKILFLFVLLYMFAIYVITVAHTFLTIG